MRGGWATLACAGGLWLLAGGAGATGTLSLRLADPDRHAREREDVTRTAVLRNDGPATLTVRLAWRTAVDAARIGEGMMTVTLPPRRETPVEVKLKMPAALRPVRLKLVLEVAGANGERARRETVMRVYPARQELPWAFLKSRRIGVLDPGGGLLKRLQELGGRPEALPSPAAAGRFEGDLMVVGEEAMADVEEWERVERTLWARESPPPVLALYQGYGAPGEKRRGMGDRLRIVVVGHPFFRELEADDLEGWRDEGWVAREPLLKAPAAGRFRVLAVAGGESKGEKLRIADCGMRNEKEEGAVMMEEALPGGRLILRGQVPLLERWAREPACELLLNVMMRYALGAKGKFDYEHDYEKRLRARISKEETRS